jgi:prolyl-tRNA editing enzyme YbaK/EbsC (Cys-tRNA(Pro) deacylase)
MPDSRPTAAPLPGAVARVAADLAALGCKGWPQLRSQAPPPGTANGYTTTQLFLADGHYVLVVVSGNHRADPVNLSGVLGIMDVIIVPDLAIAVWTAQDPSYLAPVGHTHPINVVMDIELSTHPRIWLPAGHADYVFPTSYAELLQITAGTAAEVGELP